MLTSASAEVAWLCSHPEQVFSCTTLSLFNWKKGFHSSVGIHSTLMQSEEFPWYYTLWVVVLSVLVLYVYVPNLRGPHSRFSCTWNSLVRGTGRVIVWGCLQLIFSTPSLTLCIFPIPFTVMCNPSPVLGIPIFLSATQFVVCHNWFQIQPGVRKWDLFFSSFLITVLWIKWHWIVFSVITVFTCKCALRVTDL